MKKTVFLLVLVGLLALSGCTSPDAAPTDTPAVRPTLPVLTETIPTETTPPETKPPEPALPIPAAPEQSEGFAFWRAQCRGQGFPWEPEVERNASLQNMFYNEAAAVPAELPTVELDAFLRDRGIDPDKAEDTLWVSSYRIAAANTSPYWYTLDLSALRPLCRTTEDELICALRSDPLERVLFVLEQPRSEVVDDAGHGSGYDGVTPSGVRYYFTPDRKMPEKNTVFYLNGKLAAPEEAEWCSLLYEACRKSKDPLPVYEDLEIGAYNVVTVRDQEQPGFEFHLFTAVYPSRPEEIVVYQLHKDWWTPVPAASPEMALRFSGQYIFPAGDAEASFDQRDNTRLNDPDIVAEHLAAIEGKKAEYRQLFEQRESLETLAKQILQLRADNAAELGAYGEIEFRRTSDWTMYNTPVPDGAQTVLDSLRAFPLPCSVVCSDCSRRIVDGTICTFEQELSDSLNYRFCRVSLIYSEEANPAPQEYFTVTRLDEHWFLYIEWHE